MTELRLKRVRYINEWRVNTSMQSIFPTEIALLQRVQETESPFFIPFKFPYSDNKIYHYHLNFLIESLELLPLKLDIAFDICWRAFESLFPGVYFASISLNTSLMLARYCQNYEIEELRLYGNGLQSFSLLTGSIPVQSCEYLTERIFSGYHVTSPTGSSKRILDRLKLSNINTSLVELIHETAVKYGAPAMTSQNRRKSAMLFRKALQGLPINVLSYSGSLSVSERLSLILLGILYTFRNDRFHGDLQPPFKSSLATLQTYTHAHYAFLFTYCLFMQTLNFSNLVSLKKENVIQNIDENVQIFTHLYGKHLTR